MGLLDSFLPQGGLLGMGGVGGNMPAQSLLGSMYDPQQARNIKLKNLLLGTGIGLLTQGPSPTPISFGSSLARGLGAGLTQAQQAGQDYMQNAMTAEQLKRQQTQDSYTNAQHARDLSNQAAYDQFVSTLPPDEQTIAKMDPAGFASNYFARKNMQLNSDMVGKMAATQPPPGAVQQPPQAPMGVPGGLGIAPYNSASQPQQQQAPQQMGLGAGPQIDINSIPIPQSVLSEAQLAAQGKDGMAGAAKIISDYRQHMADNQRQDYYQSPDYLSTKATTEAIAQGQAKRQLDAPATIVQTQNKMMALDDMKRSVNDVLSDPGLDGIAGMYGKLPIIPGTARANAAAKLDALKTKTAFSALQALREGSPTGGALGQISDKEETMLQNSISSLDKAQSSAQLRQSLKQISDFVDRHQASIKGEFKATYGKDIPALDVPKTPANVIMYDAQGNRVQ